MNVKVKICGIRSVEAAVAAVDAGADFIGLNFVPTSKRKISIETGLGIMEAVRNKVITVGIFQDQTFENIYEIKEYLGLDFVQLHGEETPEFCAKVSDHVIKVFKLKKDFDEEKTIAEMKKYATTLYLLDRAKQGKGDILPYEKVARVALQFPIFLSGGLTPKNVKEAVRVSKPFGVDVAGGIETDGKEDVEKIKKFIKNAKSV